MSDLHHGSCLCGAVEYRVAGAFEAFFLCHCGRCRKATGSAHAANLFSTSARLTWVAGAAQVKSYRVPGARHEKSFCGICGSALPSLQANGALLVVPAGSLDSPVATQPDAHIFCASRADWDDALDLVARLDGAPG